MIPVILSGGSGTRLWPMSRSQYPKQFLPLVSDKTMIQATVSRLVGLNDLESPIVVCNENHRFIVAEQLREQGVNPQAIILEPVGRNTAPAVAVAALAADSIDDVLLVLPADHSIVDEETFREIVKKAEIEAKKDKLVTFGIVPDSPETGYGYIRYVTQSQDSLDSKQVAEFVEKPDIKAAQDYLNSGNYLWNSGMFAFTAGKYLEELEKFQPEMLSACRAALEKSDKSYDFIRLNAHQFSICPSDSIDYAVMEKTENAVVIPLDAGWSDVGSWSALWDVSEKDPDGNSLQGDVLVEECKNSYLHSECKLVAGIGLEDMVVIETDDALLVSPKKSVQKVKKIVDQLKAKKRSESEVHRKVYRPWGYYDSVDIGRRHQTKRIVVNPGAKLSIQMHHHRAEHWIVVSGTAKVTQGETQQLLSENESAYIPIGMTHSLENPGVIPLEMIEVQTGSYLGEDDIVRFDDRYGRHEE